MKLEKRYTDEFYASIQEIKNDFPIGSHIVVHQIEKYRNQYQLFFYYENDKYSIIYLPKIQKLLNSYYEFNSKDILHPFIQIFISRNILESCNNIIHKYSLPIEILDSFNYLYSYEDDITKSFLEWFEHLTTFSFMKVLLYARRSKYSYQQKMFFKDKDYFTILDYQKEMGICYETARFQLNELVNLNYIKRYKIGKRYFYKEELCLK